MRLNFIFLSTVIPDPNSSDQNIDICFRSLIDELMQLWTLGDLNYDVSTKQNFLLRAYLMWTMNNISAYGMVSG
jgi:hypothetical protein